ncbi:MAG: hypothetical protein M3071_23335 [Actinomycetota bacterium]|nr:hypothetical protein [Actinomycetota bacterium]
MPGPPFDPRTRPVTRSRSELRSLARRTLKELIHGEKDLEDEVESAARKVFRSRVALGIVALSILSALAGWRASVFDEQSSSSTATYHEELLVQQQREQEHEAAISRDLRRGDCWTGPGAWIGVTRGSPSTTPRIWCSSAAGGSRRTTRRQRSRRA